MHQARGQGLYSTISSLPHNDPKKWTSLSPFTGEEIIKKIFDTCKCALWARVSSDVCACVRVCACVHVCARACAHARAHVRECVHMCMCVYMLRDCVAHVSVCVHVRTYV